MTYGQFKPVTADSWGPGTLTPPDEPEDEAMIECAAVCPHCADGRCRDGGCDEREEV